MFQCPEGHERCRHRKRAEHEHQQQGFQCPEGHERCRHTINITIPDAPGLRFQCPEGHERCRHRFW